ncbi:hypothetical protein TWF281_004840 [Arthrobotrys megalospora]
MRHNRLDKSLRTSHRPAIVVIGDGIEGGELRVVKYSYTAIESAVNAATEILKLLHDCPAVDEAIEAPPSPDLTAQPEEIAAIKAFASKGKLAQYF